MGNLLLFAQEMQGKIDILQQIYYNKNIIKLDAPMSSGALAPAGDPI